MASALGSALQLKTATRGLSLARLGMSGATGARPQKLRQAGNLRPDWHDPTRVVGWLGLVGWLAGWLAGWLTAGWVCGLTDGLAGWWPAVWLRSPLKLKVETAPMQIVFVTVSTSFYFVTAFPHYNMMRYGTI